MQSKTHAPPPSPHKLSELHTCAAVVSHFSGQPPPGVAVSGGSLSVRALSSPLSLSTYTAGRTLGPAATTTTTTTVVACGARRKRGGGGEAHPPHPPPSSTTESG